MPLLQVLNQLNPIAQAAGLVESALGYGSGKPTVTQEKYDELVHYFKFASTAYALLVVNPNGCTLVTTLFDLLTDTHGYIARDDKKKEIILAFRGSVTPTNFVVDGLFKLVEAASAFFKAPVGTKVHFGFQSTWNAVAGKATTIMREQLAAYPGYSFVTTGHSLGGAMAALAGVALKQAHPDVPVRIYTYGQPRTGDPAFAKYANLLVGVTNIHRVVHSYDGVPTMVPRSLGYKHFGTEYWLLDPSSPKKTFICNAAGEEEDPKGSACVPTSGINPAHLEYFGIPYITPFFV